MAKPRIFISSTFYDLKQVRLELDKFIDNMGYESVRNEAGDIPYGKDEALQQYCYKEIENVDILISIIGGRFGSTSSEDKKASISQQELRTALKENKHVFIFIEKSVFTEYETYLLNKQNDKIIYKFVDNVNIYKFIEEIKVLPNNNNIKDFDTAEDIVTYLKDQFAGLFKQYIIDSKRYKEAIIIKDIENTAKVLKSLVDYIKDENTDKGEQIKEILKTSHPIINEVKNILNIPYKFYFEGKNDLISLFSARGYKMNNNYGDEYIIFEKKSKDETKINRVLINKDLFDSEGLLKYIKPDNWEKDFVKQESEDIDDLPF